MDLWTSKLMEGVTAEGQAQRAIAHALMRIKSQPDVAFQCGFATETFSLLTEALATLSKEPLDEVRKFFAPTKEETRDASEAYTALREIVSRFDELNGRVCQRGCGNCIRCLARRGLGEDV